MLDFCLDGTIKIDFENDKPSVVVKRPPFGAFKRLRAEAQDRQDKQLALRTELLERARIDKEEREAEDAPDDVKNRPPFNALGEIEEAAADMISSWWLLALRGDDTFKGLATQPVPEPDDWPAYLVVGMLVSEDMPTVPLENGMTIPNRQGIIFAVLDFWRRVPLARGGQPVSATDPSGNGHSPVVGSMR
jgi:hypothetical protein